MSRREEVLFQPPLINVKDLQAYREDSRRSEFKNLVEKQNTSKLTFNSEDYFEQEIRNLWKKLQDTRRWIQKAYAELAKLPKTPKTFDEILATIDPGRVNKVKEKLKLVDKIQERRKQLAVTEEVSERSVQIRLWAFIPVEQQCVKKLANLSEIVTERMGIAAWMFKKRIQEFIKEYWSESIRFRQLLRDIAKTINISPAFSNMSSKEIVKVLESTRTIDIEYRMKQHVLARLSRLGTFIGTIHSAACQNCLKDAKDLKSIFENLAVKIKNRFTELLRLLNEKKKDENIRRLTAIDELHRQKYVEIFEWVDVRTGNILAWINQTKKQTVNVPIICSHLSELLNKQIPEVRQQIRENMTVWSSCLSGKKYGFMKRVLDREANLQACLLTLEGKAEEQHRRCLVVLRAQAVRDVVYNSYGLADANNKLSSICLLISLYSDGKILEEDEEEDEENVEDSAEREAKLSSSGSGKQEDTEEISQRFDLDGTRKSKLLYPNNEKKSQTPAEYSTRKSELVDSDSNSEISEFTEITIDSVPDIGPTGSVISLDMSEICTALSDNQTPSPVSGSLWNESLDLELQSPTVSVDPSTVIVRFGSDEEVDLTPSVVDVDEELNRLRRRVFELRYVERQLNEERERNEWFRNENHHLMQTNNRLAAEIKQLKQQQSTTLYSMAV
jgi:hypothetical protein